MTSPRSAPSPPANSGKQGGSGSYLPFLSWALAGALAILFLPLLVLNVLERTLDLQLDSADRSLAHFFLFILWITYLAILGFRDDTLASGRTLRAIWRHLSAVLGLREPDEGKPQDD